jgi:putative hydrolase of HD superfamily
MKTTDLLKFIEFTHKFQQVKRRLFVNHEMRDENDVEHSFQLAFLGWYIISSQNLSYNVDLVIKYSMIHDLVEIYAGDTYFESGKNLQDTKEERERKALQQIQAEFPEFIEMTDLITNYEGRKDKESEFVYALDKMIPVLNIYLDKGRSWKRDKVTFEMIRNKDNKIKVNDDVMEIWLDFMKLVEEENESLFNL